MAEAEANEPRGSSLQNLPAEILYMVIEHMEYASDVHAISQMCHQLCAFADKRLVSHFASECSPRGLNRVINSRNVTVVDRLVSAPNFHLESYRKGHPDPLLDDPLVAAAIHGFLDALKVLVGGGESPDPSRYKSSVKYTHQLS